MTFFQKNRIFITFILTDIYENDLSGKRIKKHSTQKNILQKFAHFKTIYYFCTRNRETTNLLIANKMMPR